MKKSFKSLTTAQLAKLHGVNKRTLHYYDDIGLFSPRAKGENGYRFYDAAQSLDFEYIRMLKELNMSIDEIAAYCKAPTPARFLEIASAKEEEIGRQIKKLRHAQKVLRAKREQAAFCGELREREIRIEACRAERLLVLPYDFAEDDMQRVFAHAKEKWSIEQIRMGIGGFISLDKVYSGNFEAFEQRVCGGQPDAPKGELFVRISERRLEQAAAAVRGNDRICRTKWPDAFRICLRGRDE